jgi:undecaprenyl-diphosphatase
MIPINYRPVLIDGFLEISYPSSTTLLVLCVMPTLTEQLSRRLRNFPTKKTVTLMTAGFSLFMVIGRLVSGVHWLTDIIGSILLSTGLFSLYKATILLKIKEVKH